MKKEIIIIIIVVVFIIGINICTSKNTDRVMDDLTSNLNIVREEIILRKLQEFK